jgi:DNA polymerase-1
MIVLDAETTGVDWKKNWAVGWAVCWGPKDGEAAYLPIRHEGGSNLNEKTVTSWLKDILRRPDLHVVGHSLKFDLHMAENDGILAQGPVECTQVNEALIDENLFRYSLEDCAGRYHDVPAKKGTDLYAALATRFGGEATRQAQIGNFHRLEGNNPLAVEYAVGDVRTTWALKQEQQKQILAQDLSLVHGVECRVTRALWRMERNGVRVHEGRLAWLDQHLRKLLERNKNLVEGINVRSTPQIAAFLEKKGLDRGQWRTTERGNPSFTENWLKQHEWGQMIVAVRKIETLLASFVDPLKERHLWRGRVHCNFNQLKQDDYGTVTGRLSSNDPNMQQIPKRDKDLAPLFRMLFLPEEGHSWIAADYNQQEYRLFAEYSGPSANGEPNIFMRGYMENPPVDAHSMVAQKLGVPRDPTAKRMNFGLVTGMGSVTLAGHLGMSIPEAKKFHAEYHNAFPEAKQFRQVAESYAIQRGWVRTKLKRRRRFPDKRFAHKAGNSIIQGSGADIMKSKMAEIADYLVQEKAESRMLLSVHDELNLSAAPGEEKIAKRCLEIMVSFTKKDMISLEVPMVVDSHDGTDWGRASYPDYNKWPKGV